MFHLFCTAVHLAGFAEKTATENWATGKKGNGKLGNGKIRQRKKRQPDRWGGGRVDNWATEIRGCPLKTRRLLVERKEVCWSRNARTVFYVGTNILNQSGDILA